MEKYLCVVCGYVYEPAKGDPNAGIKPATAFENIPDDWACPVCGAGKNDFVLYDEEILADKEEPNRKNISDSNNDDLDYNEIVKDVFAVGSEHWDRELFDELIPLPDGTSYNAYLIKTGNKNVLIDTVEPEKTDDLLDHLLDLDIRKIDYIISNHAEQDHSGAIPAILDIYPEAKILTNPKCKNMLQDLLEIDEEAFITVDDGQRKKIGNKTFEFIYTPWVHWPETMSTLLVEDKILFSCDFFGSHRATSKLFVYDQHKVIEDAKRYYAEIMMPFRNHIKKNIAKLDNKEIEFIAPSHGPVYDNPDLIINAYKNWISPNVKNKIVIPYVSMHESTAILVDYLVKSFTAYRLHVIPFNLTKTDFGELSMELVDAATIIFGSSMVLGGAHPQAVYAAYLTNALRPKAKYISVVGSYGWGGKMIKQFESLLANMKKAKFLEPVLIKGIPKEQDLDEIDKFVQNIVKLHNEL